MIIDNSFNHDWQNSEKTYRLSSAWKRLSCRSFVELAAVVECKVLKKKTKLKTVSCGKGLNDKLTHGARHKQRLQKALSFIVKLSQPSMSFRRYVVIGDTIPTHEQAELNFFSFRFLFYSSLKKISWQTQISLFIYVITLGSLAGRKRRKNINLNPSINLRTNKTMENRAER